MRRLSALVTALLLLIIVSGPVCADVNVSIPVHDNTEYAVFYLKFAGTVSSLAITSPSGVRFDASSAGAAYRVSDGKIQIGVRYAEVGRWAYEIIGEPGDAFKMGYSQDASYGDFAGDPPPAPPETTAPPTPTTTPTPTATPTPTPTPTVAPPPPETTVPPATEPPPTTETAAPSQSETSPVVVPKATGTPTPKESAETTTETTVQPTKRTTPSATPIPSEESSMPIQSTLDPTVTSATPDETLPSIQPSEDIDPISPVTEDTESSHTNYRLLSVILFVSLFLVGIILLYRKRFAIMEFMHEQRLFVRMKSLQWRKAQLAYKAKREEKARTAKDLAILRAEAKAKQHIEIDNRKEAEAQARHEKEERSRMEREEQRRIRDAALTKQKEELLQQRMEEEAHPSKKDTNVLLFWKKRKPIHRFFLYQHIGSDAIQTEGPSFSDYQVCLSDDLVWSHDADMVLSAVREKVSVSSGDILVMDYETSGAAYRIDESGLHDCPSFFADHRKSIDLG